MIGYGQMSRKYAANEGRPGIVRMKRLDEHRLKDVSLCAFQAMAAVI
jgi:hypothetical protein